MLRRSDAATMAEAADHAIDNGVEVAVSLDDMTVLVLVPDIKLLEHEANGDYAPHNTVKLYRHDGRSVNIYKLTPEQISQLEVGQREQ